jgi:hypothetical protein
LSCPDVHRPCFFYQYGIEKKVNPDEEEEDEDEEGFGSTASKKEDDDPVMRKRFTIIERVASNKSSLIVKMQM